MGFPIYAVLMDDREEQEAPREGRASREGERAATRQEVDGPRGEKPTTRPLGDGGKPLVPDMTRRPDGMEAIEAPREQVGRTSQMQDGPSSVDSSRH